jgi:hypothetical protein
VWVRVLGLLVLQFLTANGKYLRLTVPSTTVFILSDWLWEDFVLSEMYRLVSKPRIAMNSTGSSAARLGCVLGLNSDCLSSLSLLSLGLHIESSFPTVYLVEQSSEMNRCSVSHRDGEGSEPLGGHFLG